MKKKWWIIGILVSLFAIIGVFLFTLYYPDEASEISQRTMFRTLAGGNCYFFNGYSNEGERGVTAYGKGEKVVHDHLYDGSNPRKYVFSLMDSMAITTFKHAYADVCLTSQKETADTITLEYKARQVYYTNSKYVETYTFSVKIDKTDKSITVITPEDSI